MKRKILIILNIIICFINLGISLILFYNAAIFADENNLSSSDIRGSFFWLCADWIRLILMTLGIILLVATYFSTKKSLK